MTSHKPLKSVVHNFGHSFISLMNYSGHDYFLGHLLKQARITHLNRLEVDILNNKSNPQKLLTKTIADSIENWNSRFPYLVNSSGSTMDFVKEAKMTIEFDLEKTRPYPNNQRIIENPFYCEVKIVDNRGKEYKYKHEGWWYPES